MLQVLFKCVQHLAYIFAIMHGMVGRHRGGHYIERLGLPIYQSDLLLCTPHGEDGTLRSRGGMQVRNKAGV